ncbi:MAG: hypothetical protein KF802_06240 [Bdellovibrionaceae bacterium]|nr:hypothetical protein [Pseudobdellovibrionaceae bacterium]
MGLLLIVCLVLAGAAARAAELFEFQRPVRALGMGGVYLPFVEDTDAVIWNPAVLGDNSALSWEVFNVGLGGNGDDVVDLYRQMQDSNCSGSACYNRFYGKPLWAGLGTASKFAMPRFGVTFFNSTTLQGILHNPAFPSLNLTYLSDTISAASYGFPLGPGLTFGTTFKRIARWGGTQDISLSTITSGGESVLDQFNQRGTAYGLDLGAQFKIPGPITTIFGVHWQDVGSTAFAPESGLTAPPRIKDNLSFGLGSELDLPGLDVRGGLEYRHITLQGEPIGKKLHVGAELGLPLVDLRVGLNQGYPTLGASMDLFFLKFDLARYTEETGVYPGQTPATRYKLELSCAFSIDADFNFSDKEGRRRKLKQRR